MGFCVLRLDPQDLAITEPCLVGHLLALGPLGQGKELVGIFLVNLGPTPVPLVVGACLHDHDFGCATAATTIARHFGGSDRACRKNGCKKDKAGQTWSCCYWLHDSSIPSVSFHRALLMGIDR